MWFVRASCSWILASCIFLIATYLFETIAILNIPFTLVNLFLCVLVVDLLSYWHHRLCHEINILWAVHIVHHQSEDLNLSTVFRVSFLAVFTRALFLIWAVVIGFSPEMVVTSMLFLGIFQFLTHSRVVGKLGVLDQVFSTPSNHRVHHARNEEYINHNYGHIFILWDKLFKTYIPEKFEPVYGITTGIEDDNVGYSNFSYLKDLFSRVRRTERFRDKVVLFFARPEWTPKDVGFTPPVYETDPDGNRIIRQQKVNQLTGLYLIFNSAITLGLFVLLISKIGDPKQFNLNHFVSNFSNIGLIALIVFSAFSLGRFTDKKWDSQILESLRLIALPFLVGFIFFRSIGIWLPAAVAIYSVVMLLWLWKKEKVIKTRASQYLDS